MTENSAFLGAQPRAGPPKTYLQAAAGSQRHFSLAEVLPWALPRLGGAVIWRMSAKTHAGEAVATSCSMPYTSAGLTTRGPR
jgi:hypothetical protein